MKMSGVDDGRVGRCIRWFINHSSWSPQSKEICRSFAAIQEQHGIRNKFLYITEISGVASLTGRLMLRRAVSLLANQPNTQVQLSRTPRGRPYPENLPGLQINISHAGDLTVLAAEMTEDDDTTFNEYNNKAEEGFLLGVDVMPTSDRRVERTENFFRLMRKQFTDLEWETILSKSTEEKKLESFYRHWSLKESYVKAVGTGLNLDLRTIQFKLKSDPDPGSSIYDTQVCVNQVERDDWRFEESLIQDHLVSVAVKTKCRQTFYPETWREVGLEDLLPEDEDLLSDLNPDDWNLFTSKEKTKPF